MITFPATFAERVVELVTELSMVRTAWTFFTRFEIFAVVFEELGKFEAEEDGEAEDEEVATRVHVDELQVRQTDREAGS